MALVKDESVLVKIESTYNTDSTPANSDAVPAENISWAHVGARSVERPIVNGDLSPLVSIYAGSLRSISFDVEVKGSGSAGTAPDIGPVLIACGMDETVSVSTSVIYTPEASGSHVSVTVYYYSGGLRYVLTGCYGTANFTFIAGERIMMNVTLTGHSSAPTTQTLVSPSFSDTTAPEPVLGTTFTINSYAAVINEFSFSDGNVVSTPASVTASDGYADLRISERKVTGKIDPEDTVTATQDWEALFRARTAMAVVAGPIGSAGNIVQFDLAAASYNNQGQGDRDGIRTRVMDFEALPTSVGGLDEFTITFT